MVTTINENTVVETLWDEGAIVIKDEKTPTSVPGIGVNIQDIVMKQWSKKLNKYIPRNSDARRNIGYLFALDAGADVVISLDDDNYPVLSFDTFLDLHCAGGKLDTTEITSQTDWFNYLALLDNSREAEIYPRGFPYFARFKEPMEQTTYKKRKIAINQGLWYGSPDVDAITHLTTPCVITKKQHVSHLIMSRNTWAPINTQNTSISKQAMYCYYYFERPFGRHGDIIGGYLARKCIDAMNQRVSYGYPMVDHRRNKHDYIKDMIAEHIHIINTEKLLPILRGIKLYSNNYPDLYNELADDLVETKMWKQGIYDEYTWVRVADTMHLWVDAVDKVIQ